MTNMIPSDTHQEMTLKTDTVIAAIHNYSIYAAIHGYRSAGALSRKSTLRDLIIIMQKTAYLRGLDDGIQTVKLVT
jgi:hypothetical protein